MDGLANSRIEGPEIALDPDGNAGGSADVTADPHRSVSVGPTYPGEDTRPTSTKELLGWYSYAWASEVFVVCGVGSFIPITLEELARARGVLLSDGTTPCLQASHTAQCVVRILHSNINTASFAMYSFSISVLFQALLIVSMSGAADHGRYRKSFLLAFALLGSLATMLFFAVAPSIYLLGGFLAILSNTCFGASSVLLNSFLPLLVRQHPSIRCDKNAAEANSISSEDEGYHGPSNATEALLSEQRDRTTRSTFPEARSSPELLISTRISSQGIGIGYVAAVLFQVSAVLLLAGTGSGLFSLRLVLFLIGLWWLFFTIPAAFFLRPRPGPPLSSSSGASAGAYLAHAWRLIFRTIQKIRKLRDIATFLLAWFLLSDALATVSSTAVLFAKTELHMPPARLGLIGIIATLSGVCGAFAWSALGRHFRLLPSYVLISIVALFEVIPLYSLLSFIPAIRDLGVFGLQQEWEIYVVAGAYGLVLGGVGGYGRGLYGTLIPPGSEAAFYALYAITDKGSSVLGPTVVGIITDRWGQIRPAFVFLAVLIGLPIPLLFFVDVERGKEAGRKLAQAEEDIIYDRERQNDVCRN